MTSIRTTFALAAALVSAGIGSAWAQDAADRTVDQYTCKDVMRDDDQDASIAFLHGYILGKSGGAAYNVEALAKQTDTFIDRCLDNPGAKAVDVMAEAVKAK